MPFPRRLLNDGEEVVVDLRPHWWYFAGPAAAVVASAAVVAAVAVADSGGVLPGPVYWVLGLLLLLNLVWLVARLVRWGTTNFVVTTDRLIYRSGVVAKSGREIPLERVNDISFNQRVVERLVGAGDLLIESGGERGQQSFHDVRHPARVMNEIYHQIEAAQARDADRAAGRRELSVVEQLEKLDELRQRGLVTQAEFEVKKAQLLERM